MTTYAQIRATRHQLPLGHSYNTFQWIGDPWAPVRISRWAVGDFDLKTLPWKLIEIEYEPLEDVHIYVRADNPGAWLTLVREKTRQAIWWIEPRLILTLGVWFGFDSDSAGGRLAWSNLKPVEQFRKKFAQTLDFLRGIRYNKSRRSS